MPGILVSEDSKETSLHLLLILLYFFCKLVIIMQGCIMSLAFHPSKPSILAGGNFNGEIFLWDLSKDDDPLIS